MFFPFRIIGIGQQANSEQADGNAIEPVRR
jgi:hypothetical protein